MRKLFIILLSMSFIACGKEKGKYCFDCHVVCGIGSPSVKDTAFCSDDINAGARQFKDALGNDCSSQCTRK